MNLPLLSLVAGLALWVAISVWAELRFRRLARGREYTRKVFGKWETLVTDDPYVKRIHRRRTWIVYGSFAVIAIVLLVAFPGA